MRPFLLAIALVVTGCSISTMGPVWKPAKLMSNATVADLKLGMSVKDVTRTLEGWPVSTSTFLVPDNPGVSMTVLEYKGALAEYQPDKPHWVLFADDKLIAEGQGTRREAELNWSMANIDDLYHQGKISLTESERMKYRKLQQLYSLTSYETEYFTYRIVVASRKDKGEIDNDMANYLIAQKKSEIDVKLSAERQNAVSQYQTERMIAMQRAALFMQTMSTFQSATSTRSRANCVTNRYGSTSYTNCY